MVTATLKCTTNETGFKLKCLKVSTSPKSDKPSTFPVKEDFCSNDDHHCLKVMLINELHKT